MAVGSMRVCKCCFFFLFLPPFFFFSSSALFPRVDHSRRTNRMGKKIRSPFRVILFSRSLSAPLPPSPLLSSFFSSEVQRDTSCARLAARDYHTICIPSSLPLDYYFPAIPANSRPLDRERERGKRERKNVKFSLSRPRSSSNTFRTRVSQIP